MGRLLGTIGLAVFIAAIIGGLRPHRVFSAAPVLVLLGIVWLIWSLLKSSKSRQLLVESGAQAEARIKEIHDTGANLMDKRIMLLDLEVMPSGQPAFTARVRALIPNSERKQYARGAMVRVNYDPQSPDNMIVTGLAGAARAARVREPRKPEPAAEPIPAAEAFNRQMKLKGVLARANIVEVRDSGQKRDGDPFIELRLEVKPVGSAAFTARAAAVIRSSLLSEFEPGREVWVKHDPKQPDRVALYDV